MKDRLEHFIRQHGLKHWSFAARKDAEFMAWIDDQTPSELLDLPFAQRVYAAVYGEPMVCERGNRKGFDSIERGFRFCGRAGKCACAAESVSKALEIAHASKSEEDRREIARKGATTVLARYGVSNAGQTPQAKKAHHDFYADPDKTSEAVQKGKETMLARHGVDNGLKTPAALAARADMSRYITPEKRRQGASKRIAGASKGELLNLSYVRLVAKYRAMNIEFVTDREFYSGVSDQKYYEFRCLKCSLDFQDYIDNGHTPSCPHCDAKAPSYSSREEQEVADFLSIDLGLEIGRNNKKLLRSEDGKFGGELDIVIPSLRIAIEYCGLYWHSEFAGGKGKQYHADKLRRCNEAGYRLITIFSDEWLQERKIVKFRLRAILGQENERRFARKMQCRRIEAASARTFLNQYHIQGYAEGASICYGLFDGENIIAVMTFGKRRRILNNADVAEEWELYRLASCGIVVGGAGKMLKAFIRDQRPKIIVSYCDLRWGTGQVYEKLGFHQIGHSDPGYWWVEKFATRKHRFNYTKAKLVEEGYDRSLTEVEIMKSRGFDRIWDCGNKKFELRI